MHKTVLLEEAISGLEIKAGEIFLDGTLGAGGHSFAVCEKFGKSVQVIGLDADEEAIARTKERIEKCEQGSNFTAKKTNFREIKSVLESMQIDSVDKILLDLGLSSDQLENSGRGFTFQKNEPLLMTFKRDIGKEDLTAMDIVNTWAEESLKAIIKGFGEEPFAGRIARIIIESRQNKRIETTTDLVEVIRKVIPLKYQHRRTHFATKTFQALRMATNNELDSLREFLKDGVKYLNKGGRIAIISFHSLEDRIVKRFFKETEINGVLKIITKRPICPTEEEIKENKRSRSAKLRIAEKIK